MSLEILDNNQVITMYSQPPLRDDSPTYRYIRYYVDGMNALIIPYISTIIINGVKIFDGPAIVSSYYRGHKVFAKQDSSGIYSIWEYDDGVSVKEKENHVLGVVIYPQMMDMIVAYLI